MFDQPVNQSLIGLDYQHKRYPFGTELVFQFPEIIDELVVLFLVRPVSRVIVPYLQLLFRGKMGFHVLAKKEEQLADFIFSSPLLAGFQ